MKGEYILSLIQKLANIRKKVEVIQKNKAGYGYKYVDLISILAKVTVGLVQENVSLFPSIVPGTFHVEPVHYMKTKVLKNGEVTEEHVNEYLVQAETKFTWVDNDNPEDKLDVVWELVGSQSDPSQAFGSGATYCERYFLMSFFHIATPEDDPDHWRSKQAEAMAEEQTLIAKAIVNEISEVISANVNDENRAGLVDVIKKYVKKNGKASGDYTGVTNPETAAHVLKAVKEYFNIKDEGAENGKS